MRICQLILLFLLPACIYAQDRMSVEEDSTSVEEIIKISGDSFVIDSAGLNKKDLTFLEEKKKFAPDPNKALIYSAIFPGLGQVYNRKYWKLPIIYGGLLGCTYAITWNGNQYSGYKKAYRDFADEDETTNFWRAYRPYSYPENLDEWPADKKQWFSSALKSKRDYYRRYRDLSIIISVGVYAICMIDAYVDAQLFSFDISPDLSMRIDPVFYERTNINSRSLGMQLSFTF